MDLGQRVDEAFRQGCKGVTIWRAAGRGYQANVQNADGSWRILIGPSASQTLTETLDSAFPAKRRRVQRDDEDLI